MSPINEVLDAAFLQKVKVQRQHVLFFTLHAPYNLADVQAAFNLWVTRRPGLNAATVHSPSDLLVVFANESPAEQLPECFQVALAFIGNVCPLVETQSSESVSVWVSGTWASIQELNNITQALVDLEEPGFVGIEVDEGWSQLRIQPRRTVDVVRVRDAATNALRQLGRKSAVKCNRIVLYQCAVPLSPFEGEVDLSTTSHRLLACVDAAHAALTSNKEDTFGEVFAHDAVMHVLSELQCEATPRHNYKYSFDMHGMKCVECVRLVLEEFVVDRPGRVGYTSIALSPTRDLLAVTAPAEQCHNVERHVQDCLAALGMACTLIGHGPDLTPVDDPQALALYSTLTKEMPSRPGPATAALSICLRPDSVRCPSCAALCRSTLLRVVPGIVHVALDRSSARMTVHHVASEVTENEILAMLKGLGYQPTISHVPLSAPTPPFIAPLSPSSPATTQYCNGGSFAPPSAHGELGPYATMGPGPTQQHRSIGRSHSHSPYAATAGADYRHHPEPSLTMHAPVTAWQCAPTPDWPHVAASPGMTEDGLTVLVFPVHPKEGEGLEDASPQQLSITIPMRLRRCYTVWYGDVQTRVQLQQSGEADYVLTEVASFEAMTEFWQIWEHLGIEGLCEGSMLSVFRSDIPPDVSHPANRCGGRWFVRGVSVDARIKLCTKLVLAMLSDALTASPGREVCGVVLSVKPSGDRIEVWVDGGHDDHGDDDGGHHDHGDEDQPTHDREREQYLRNTLSRLLGDELGHRRFRFWTHAAFERHRRAHRRNVRRAKRNKLRDHRNAIEGGESGAVAAAGHAFTG